MIRDLSSATISSSLHGGTGGVDHDVAFAVGIVILPMLELASALRQAYERCCVYQMIGVACARISWAMEKS